MIILQIIDIFNITQLTNILWLLIILAVLIALTIIIVSFLTSSRTFTGTEFSERREEIAGEEGVGVRTQTQLTNVYTTSLLSYLSSSEAVNLENIMSYLPGDKETINTVISRLREDGIIEISGDIVMLTEKGKKMIEIMKEKYWFKDIEKRRE